MMDIPEQRVKSIQSFQWRRQNDDTHFTNCSAVSTVDFEQANVNSEIKKW